MLSLEYLLEEAKNNGLPILKKRAVLREYLQVIILNSIYKQKLGRMLFFTGGTALRFFYHMPRFSEDLDFDTQELDFVGFRQMISLAQKGLHKEGFSPEISCSKRKNLFTAELYFKDLMKLYNIVDRRGIDLMLKIEVYRPSWKVAIESSVLSLYGYNFSAILLSKGSMISEKLLALLSRKRGRDIYDILFMLKKKFAFAREPLLAHKIIAEPRQLLLKFLKKLPERELKSLANQVKPFLFKEEDIELILSAPLYAEKFLKDCE